MRCKPRSRGPDHQPILSESDDWRSEYSINKRTKGKIQNALIELCDRLEIAERYGDGELDLW